MPEGERGGLVNLSIKNVPEETVEQLRERAKRNHRSLQGEVMTILEAAVAPNGLTVDEVREYSRRTGLATDDSTHIVRESRDARY